MVWLVVVGVFWGGGGGGGGGCGGLEWGGGGLAFIVKGNSNASRLVPEHPPFPKNRHDAGRRLVARQRKGGPRLILLFR